MAVITNQFTATDDEIKMLARQFRNSDYDDAYEFVLDEFDSFYNIGFASEGMKQAAIEGVAYQLAYELGE